MKVFGFVFPIKTVVLVVRKTGIFSHRNTFCDNGGILPTYKC